MPTTRRINNGCEVMMVNNLRGWICDVDSFDDAKICQSPTLGFMDLFDDAGGCCLLFLTLDVISLVSTPASDLFYSWALLSLFFAKSSSGINAPMPAIKPHRCSCETANMLSLIQAAPPGSWNVPAMLTGPRKLAGINPFRANTSLMCQAILVNKIDIATASHINLGTSSTKILHDEIAVVRFKIADHYSQSGGLFIVRRGAT
jgi:hypothetical protein